MKRILFSVLMGSLFSLGTNAQSIDPEVGVNIGSIRQKIGNNVTNSNGLLTWNFGVNWKPYVAEQLYLKPGLHYTTTGFSERKANLTLITKVDYVQLPLMLGYDFPVGDGGYDGTYFTELGAYLGYAVSATQTVGSANAPIELGKKTNQYNPFDYGLKFGLGYIAPFNIFVKGQYNLGLANGSNANNTSMTNRYFNISLGYRIAL
ncbi:MAG TPA: porin family protein [Edaphocola sp.]|nr:porin family protein [Edaphocola sp.]